MSFITKVMVFSFVLLALLGWSYWLRRDNKSKIPFVYWGFAQIYCFIAIIGVGLIQTHYGCSALWGDCYAHGYPLWLADYKPLLLHSITIWCLLAVSATLINCVVAIRGRG